MKLVVPFAKMTVMEVMSQEEARPSSCDIGMEDVETVDLSSVESWGNPKPEEAGVEMSSMSHPGEGILVLNLTLKVAVDELGKIEYLYKIPKNVEIRATKAH